jgi:transposase-like protein
MARHRRFSLEFKRQVVLYFLEKRLGLRKQSRKHNLSRKLLSQWGEEKRVWPTHRRDR